MSVLIRGMDMPENCETCAYQTKGACFASGVNKGTITIRRIDKDRPDWCPLVALPEKHGRLIDADLFNYTLMFAAMSTREKLPKDFRYGMISVLDAVKTQPTVVEAESES